MDMSTWRKVSNFGYHGKIYAQGDKRVLIDTKTGRIIISYDMKELTR